MDPASAECAQPDSALVSGHPSGRLTPAGRPRRVAFAAARHLSMQPRAHTRRRPPLAVRPPTRSPARLWSSPAAAPKVQPARTPVNLLANYDAAGKKLLTLRRGAGAVGAAVVTARGPPERPAYRSMDGRSATFA